MSLDFRAITTPDEVAQLNVILRAQHPLVTIDTVDHERARAVVELAAEQLALPLYVWSQDEGLVHLGRSAVPSTKKLVEALSFIEKSAEEALYLLPHLGEDFRDTAVKARVRGISTRLFGNRGAVVFVGAALGVEEEMEALLTHLTLPVPTHEQLRNFLNQILAELRARQRVEITLSGSELRALLSKLRGLSFEEIRRIVSVAMVRDGRFGPEDDKEIDRAKRERLTRTGALEPVTVSETLNLAGLSALKRWIEERAALFQDPDAAKRFGLDAPRGLLLIGVQGCGKSLSAKAVATAWGLPIVRFDPASLYQKFVGETERTLKRVLQTAEGMAPIVLWIDELEKAFSPEHENDGGVSRRILGTFLSWMQEHSPGVFVVATANDVHALPPELLRKGRFDETFFLDLPNDAARESLVESVLRLKKRAPARFDLAALANASRGFSGAEIEQGIVAALHSAFAAGGDLTTEGIVAEFVRAVPLSVSMRERIEALRAWAIGRAVPAETLDV